MNEKLKDNLIGVIGILTLCGLETLAFLHYVGLL